MKIRNVCVALAGIAGFSIAAIAAPPKLPPPSPRTGLTYEADIKPIFEHSCVKCHQGKKPKGRLRLGSLAGVLKGGKDGKVVRPGNSAKSMLVRNISHVGDPENWMPPRKNRLGIGPLTPGQIGVIRAWIDQGAK